MVHSPYLEELRLTSFKSFRDAVLPLRDLTLLIGRKIASERLWCREGNSERSLLQTDSPEPEQLDIIARYDNGKQGKNPALPFRSTRLWRPKWRTRSLPEQGSLPWVLHSVAWDERMLIKLCDGTSVTGPFVELAGAGILGTGDLAILAECELYSERTANVRVTVWTHDARLEAYAG